MDTPSQKVTRLISEACARYPGGMRAVFQAIQQKGGRKRSESGFYADFNANAASSGNLKMADFMAALEVTGEYDALRYLAAYFGFALTHLESVEPDAPTVEAEMLQDYPAVVAFHEAIRAFGGGSIEYETVLARLEGAIMDLRQTAAMAKRREEQCAGK